MFIVTSTTIYIYNIKLKLCAKHILAIRELFLLFFKQQQNWKIPMALGTATPPPLKDKCHEKFPYFFGLPPTQGTLTQDGKIKQFVEPCPPVEKVEVNRISLICYSLGKSYSVLGSRICWKGPSLNHVEKKWSENFNIKLNLNLYPGVLQ